PARHPQRRRGGRAGPRRHPGRAGPLPHRRAPAADRYGTKGVTVAGLDFKRAADLFMGTEEELALALGITAEEIRRFRRVPEEAPRELLARLGRTLVERGRGMTRVGEMLQEQGGECARLTAATRPRRAGSGAASLSPTPRRRCRTGTCRRASRTAPPMPAPPSRSRAAWRRSPLPADGRTPGRRAP